MSRKRDLFTTTNLFAGADLFDPSVRAVLRLRSGLSQQARNLFTNTDLFSGAELLDPFESTQCRELVAMMIASPLRRR